MARYVLVVAIVLTAAVAQAQVKIERRTTMSSSLVGRAMVTEDWTAVKGDRMMESNPASATLIDLKAEKVYTLNHLERTYRVETFDAIRGTDDAGDSQDVPVVIPTAEQLEAAQQQMRAFLDGGQPPKAPTGQRRTINGWDAQEVVTTMRTSLPGGAMVVTRTEWVATVPGVGEVDAFKKRYEAALGEVSPAEAAAQDIAIDGTLSGTTVLSIVKSGPADGTPEATRPASPGAIIVKETAEQTALGLLNSRLTGGMAALVIDAIQGRRQGPDRAADGTSGPSGVPSSTVQMEVLRISSDVSDKDLSIPAGYKEERDKERDESRGQRKR